ncbi:MAG: DNA primase, partial [Mollicutes bacterium PWAP]|nr:DNA primase [Mollicutes bacterium PWAP]
MTKSTLELIKNDVDILETISSRINVTKKGKNFWAICPFHQDTSPSLSISIEKQIFKCFVCNKAGDLISFVSRFEDISYKKAIEIIAKENDIAFTKFKEVKKYNENQEKMISALFDANLYFKNFLFSKDGNFAYDYLKNRGKSSQKIINKFDLGYAPKKGLKEYLIKKGHDESILINSGLLSENGYPFFKDRLMFAIKNSFGTIVGFSGRTLKNENPKYINSPESSLFKKNEILYNYKNSYDSIDKTKKVIIVEGFMDVIALNSIDINNVVAIMGAALTLKHTNLLKNKKVYLFLDGDEAGINASIKSTEILLKENIDVFYVINKTKLDPDEIINKKGKKEIIEILNKSIDAFLPLINNKFRNFNKDNFEDYYSIKKWFNSFNFKNKK